MHPACIRRWGSCNCFCILLCCKSVLPSQHHRYMQAQASIHHGRYKNQDERMMSIHHNLHQCGQACRCCLYGLATQRNRELGQLQRSPKVSCCSEIWWGGHKRFAGKVPVLRWSRIQSASMYLKCWKSEASKMRQRGEAAAQGVHWLTGTDNF
jgi:hypothetical protein